MTEIGMDPGRDPAEVFRRQRDLILMASQLKYNPKL